MTTTGGTLMRAVAKFFGALFVSALMSGSAFAAESYKFVWSHYIGWEPLACAESTGIVKKWANKYGISITVVLMNDYVESINAYTAGAVDGVAVTNMDVLTIPAVGGKDSTALVVGDFSNGNDGIVSKKAKSIKELRGKKLYGVELSVSHYLLARALSMNNMTERDVTFVNTSDSDIEAFFTKPDVENVVTWNPMLMEVRKHPKATMLFDSSKIPGEIIDMLVVRTDAPESLKKALTGAWYETMKIMSGLSGTSERLKMFQCIAASSGSTVEQVKAQLRTTAMFYEPERAVAFTRSSELKKTMEFVRTFSFDHGLYGDNGKSKDFVGIQFPDGSVMGDPGNVKLRFDPKYMELAATGGL